MGTAPLIAYYFGRVSLVFTISSLVAIPSTMLIVSASLGMLLLSAFSSFSFLIGKFIHIVTGLLNVSLHFLASIPCASIEDVHVSIFQLFIYYLMLLAVWVLWSFLSGRIEFK